MAKAGRPKIQLNYELIEKLAHIQCTQKEIASAMNVSVRKLQRDEEFCRIYKKGLESGKMSLRRMQWKLADKGNVTMLIWLGKQYLGQKNSVGLGLETPLEIKSKDLEKELMDKLNTMAERLEKNKENKNVKKGK